MKENEYKKVRKNRKKEERFKENIDRKKYKDKKKGGQAVISLGSKPVLL